MPEPAETGEPGPAGHAGPEPAGAGEPGPAGDVEGETDSELGPCPRELADEILCVARWLAAEAGRVRLVHAEAGLASPLPRLATFQPRPGLLDGR